jgi:hypothetical protein
MRGDMRAAGLAHRRPGFARVEKLGDAARAGGGVVGREQRCR